MRLEDLCSEYLEVEDTSEAREESAPLSSTDDCGLIFLCGPLWLLCYEFFVRMTVTVHPSCTGAIIYVCYLYNWNMI